MLLWLILADVVALGVLILIYRNWKPSGDHGIYGHDDDE